jgi:hypothetical protein
MNGRERFCKTLKFERVDRPPLFEDGLREEVLRRWHAQGLGKQAKLENLFSFDHREEIETNLEPLPNLTHWPKSMPGLDKLSARLDPNDPQRLPDGWQAKLVEWKTRDYPLILRVHRGYFLSMGVHGWHRFTDAIQLLVDEPRLVESWMNIYSEFTSRLVERILRDVQVDAALFSEPIGGNHGPLISPAMYSAFVLKSYQPILEQLKSCGVDTIIYRTYANTRALLPSVVKAGFTCVWACESNPQAMDYRDIRQEFGKDLSLIGGIDADVLRQSKEDIYRAMMEVLPPLLQAGGFIPLADGRVREDVPFDSYLYYRKLLELITGPDR